MILNKETKGTCNTEGTLNNLKIKWGTSFYNIFFLLSLKIHTFIEENTYELCTFTFSAVLSKTFNYRSVHLKCNNIVTYNQAILTN